MNPIDGVPSGNVWPGVKARGPNRNIAPLKEALNREIRISLINARAFLEPEKQNVSAPKAQARKKLPNKVSFFILPREPVIQLMLEIKKKPQKEIKRWVNSSI